MKKLVWRILPFIVFIPGAATPLGLGEIEVDSALNQPLRAEISLLSVHPDELEDVKVRLASPEAFERVGIPRPVVLQKLQFRTGVINGRAIIDVISREPIREPFLDFLVEVEWPNGRMIREYTILLDPPVLMERRAAVTPAAPVVRRSAPVREIPPAAEPAPGAVTATRTVTPVAPPQAAGDTYRVQRGDTLSGIVRQFKPSGEVSNQQMMIAMLRANPQAFGNNSIHELKAGAVLRIPDAAEAGAITRDAALAEVASQNALWREYRTQAAGTWTQSRDALPTPGEETRIAEADPGQGAEEAGSGTLEILSATQPGEAVESGAGTGTDGEAAVEAALAREVAESRLQENEALKSRIEELESLVEQQEHVITLQSEELTVLQDRLVEDDLLGGSSVQGEVGGGSVATVDDGLDVALTGDLADSSVAGAEDPVMEELVSEVLDPASGLEVAEADDSVTPFAASGEEVTQPPASVPDQLLADDRILYALGGGAVLLALVGLWMVSRRRKDTDDNDDMAELFATGARTLPAAAVAAGTAAAAGQARPEPAEAQSPIDEAAAREATGDDTGEVDTFERTAQVMVTGQVGAGLLDTGAIQPGAEPSEHAVDEVVSEADVYVAYGLFQQAEDLLKDAIEKDPDAGIYRAKLAEAYFRDENGEAFIETAEEMAAAGQNEGEYWNRVVAMGQEISPEHALFAGADTGGVKAEDFISEKPGSMDMEMTASDVGQTGVHNLESEVPETRATTETEMLEMPVTEPHDAGSAEDEDKLLDFDVDGLDFGSEDSAGQAEAAETLQDDTATLDFEISELDVSGEIGEPAASDDAADLGVSGDFAAETAEFGELVEEDLDLSGADVSETEKTAGGNVVDLGLDSPGEPEEQDELETELVEGLEGLEDLAAHFEEDDALAATAEETTQFDPASFETEIMDSASEGDSVSTKLDLARAFIDMGDAEGARSTLEEVVREGDDHQRHEAEALLKQIA